MRVSWPDVATASPRRSWARTGGVSRPLETAGGSSADRTGLFGAAFDDGKAARPRETAASRRAAAGSRSGRIGHTAAWPQTEIGGRQVARHSARPNERREPLWLRALLCGALAERGGGSYGGSRYCWRQCRGRISDPGHCHRQSCWYNQPLVVQIKQMIPAPPSSPAPRKTGPRTARSAVATTRCPLFRAYDAEQGGYQMLEPYH
jgi:hypothetical protein